MSHLITTPQWQPPNLNNWHEPLIQEVWFPDRWKMLITCLCLNMTSGRQVRPLLPVLFKAYPSPSHMVGSVDGELYTMIKPLGFANKRVYTFKRFSDEYINIPWENAKQLYGCGTYALNSDKIFYLGEWRSVTPKDGELKRYISYIRSLEVTDGN